MPVLSRKRNTPRLRQRLRACDGEVVAVDLTVAIGDLERDPVARRVEGSRPAGEEPPSEAETVRPPGPHLHRHAAQRSGSVGAQQSGSS